MKGDIEDVKVAMQRALVGPGFLAALGAAVAEKGDGFWPRLQYSVYKEERLSHLVFPMAELIAYRTRYAEDDVLKIVEHEVGVRWTDVAKNEADVTKAVERLCRATVDLFWDGSLDTITMAGVIRILSEDYSPLVPTVEHPYVKSGVVLLTVPVFKS